MNGMELLKIPKKFSPITEQKYSEPGNTVPKTEQKYSEPGSTVPKIEQLDYEPGNVIPKTEHNCSVLGITLPGSRYLFNYE
jgi:hypothetical protein